jgi:hypothetical protein
MILMTVAGGIILLIIIFIFARISQKHFNNLVEETGREEKETNLTNTRIELQEQSNHI